MEKLKKIWNYFSLFEKLIWFIGVVTAITLFIVFKNDQYHSLISAIVGMTAIVFMSKGNWVGPFLNAVFAVIYAFIAFSSSNYGTLISTLSMSLPMNVYALISWLRNPSNKGKSEAKINNIKWVEWLILACITAAITTAFYFILRYFETDNLVINTVSVATTFTAVYLTARRSKYYAIFFCLNDILLITMWSMSTVSDLKYVPMIVCFSFLLILDFYSFLKWRIMAKKQSENSESVDVVEEI